MKFLVEISIHHSLCMITREPMTLVENILEDELRSFVIERRHSGEELKQAHAQRPPVHHEICAGRKQDLLFNNKPLFSQRPPVC